MAAPRYHRKLNYTEDEWSNFDRMVIDPRNAEKVSLVATILHVNVTRIYEAIDAVGARAGDIRRYVWTKRAKRK